MAGEAMASILVVDDEQSMREFLSIMLRRQGYSVEVAADGREGMDRLKKVGFDLVISDIQMPHIDGLELLSFIRERASETAVIMITAFSTTEQAVEAMKQGAYDYITKPFKNDEIRLIVQNALERKALRQENRTLKKELERRYSFGSLIGKSKAMQEVYELIEKVAGSPVNVLISGESGTGKELVAKAIHFNSPRSSEAFVPINCGAIPENLIESELFGHEKGAFTGAVSQKKGLFEVAEGGTLFLDEIGELPPQTQVKLLRAIQEREFHRVGGTQTVKVDVRILAATNKDLAREAEEGGFREDLYYRLNVIGITLPPLRERTEDIPLLIEHFYEKLTGGRGLEVEEHAMVRMLDYRWPGNIRELENLVERCLVLGQNRVLTRSCLPAQFESAVSPCGRLAPDFPDDGLDLEAYLAGVEQEILMKALERAGGVRTKAAELLHVSFRSLRYRLAKFGINPDDEG